MTAGGTTTFTVGAFGNPAPTYQWQVSGNGGSTWTNLSDAAPYSGTTTATLTITGATAALNGSQYQCVASNGISPAATSNPAPLTVNWLSGVLLQSPSETVIAGQPVSFSAGVTGNPAPTDQWQVSTTGGSPWTNLTDGNGISGSSTGTLVIASAPAAWSGNQFQMVATNGSGSVTSTPATLAVTPLPPAHTVADDFVTLAGAAGQSGSADGTGSAALFQFPTGVAVDYAGNVYVGDTNNDTIRKITPAGVVTTLAGTAGVQGSADGLGSAAQFFEPNGVAVDSAGNVYVADSGNNTIRKITSAGVVTTLAGTAGQVGSAEGTGSAALFGSPAALAVDGSGNVYVADCTMNTIREGIPSIAGPVLILTQPQGVTIIAGQNASFSVSAAGTAPLNYQWQVSTNGGSTWTNLTDTAPYSGTATATLAITGATAAMHGYQYSCVMTNSIPSQATSTAVILTVIPSAAMAEAGEAVISSGFAATWSSVTGALGYRLDVSTNSSFSGFLAGYQNLDVGNVTSVAISGLSPNTTYYYRVRAYDGAGTGANSITITVTTTPAIVVTTPLTVSTLAGAAMSIGSSDGTGSAARFYYPSGVAADNSGNLYLADTDNHTIREVVASTGSVTTLAGLAGSSGSADGTGSAARFNNPSGVAVDSVGNVYVADTVNNTLRMVTPQGVVTTLAGSPGTAGSNDGVGSAARFQGPQGPAIDTSSNLYVADTNNHSIRKVVPSTGVVTTLAGLAGNSGSADGMGSLGRFNYPSGVAVDGAGNLYVADTENHTVRQVLPSGMVSTVAGLAGFSGGADGTGSAARFDSPSDLAVDSSGNVYVADTDNFTIREVVPSTGAVTTLAGLAGTSGSADGLGSAVRFYHPAGIAVDNSSNLYVADTDNDTLRVGLLAVEPTIQIQPQSQTVTAGMSVRFSVAASGSPAVTYQWNFNGSPISGATGSSYSLASAQSENAGSYTVVVSNVRGSVTSNPATLTVNPTPAPPSPRHGGGAPSGWFYGALLLLVAVRGFRACARVEVGGH